MSDMKKWIRLVESNHPVVATAPAARGFERDATVVLGPSVGGGVGRFVEFTTEGAALVDVKGVVRELAEGEYALPERDLENGNDWFHMSVKDITDGSLNDRPEFRPGDMVKIADVYGTVIGPGFGVFVGYGTTGEDCIVLFDGKQIVVPVANVAAVLEQNAKDNFDQMDNDGNLSPMSFGSDNVKIEQPQNSGMQSREPAMDHRDEFTKWMEAVEEALKTEGCGMTEELPVQTNACGCGSWNCPTCFPDQDGMMAPMAGEIEFAMPVDQASVCPTCGHAPDDGHQHSPQGCGDQFGLEEVSDDNLNVDDMMAAPMEEEPQEFTQEPMPRSSDGRGVKLGDIVQKTEYKPAGSESPLTHGDDLEEVVGDEFDNSEPDWDADPLAVKDYHDQMGGNPQSEEDVEAAMDMISEIKYMQSMGLSKADRDFSEDELANMGFPQLKQLYSQVTGNVAEQGNITMENVDKDVAAMLATLKKYDKLVESSGPVLGMKTLNEKKPDFLDFDKDDDKAEPMTKALKDKEKGEVGKKDDDKKKVDESSQVDPEILEWMQRFSKLGKMG